MRTLSLMSVFHLALSARAQLSMNVRIPNEEFEAALNKPNATSRYPIDGFNVMKPYPFNEVAHDIDGWYLEFNASIMSAANSEDEWFIPKDGYVAGASLKLVPPPELELRAGGGIKGVDRSWHVCASILDYDGFSKATTERGKTDDGSCFKMFGQECAQALLSAYSTKASNIDTAQDPDTRNPDTLTGCSVPRKPPPACEGVFKLDGDIPQTYGPLGLDEAGFGVKNNYQFGSEGFKDKTNTTEYDLFAGLARPVFISWGFNRNLTRAGGQSQQVRYAGTTMRCVRAVNATAGSTAPSPPIEEVKDENGDKYGGQNQAPGNNDNNKDSNNNKGSGSAAAGKLAGLGSLGTIIWGLGVALLVALTC